MAKSIRDYLPEKKENIVLVQARLPKDLVEQVREVIKREKLTWVDVLIACLKRFLDEMNGKA